MISSGSKEVGAAKITGELLDIVIRMPEAMKKLTGVDITKVYVCFIYCNYDIDILCMHCKAVYVWVYV